MSNTKTNGPLFAMFPFSGQIGPLDTLQYNSPGENHLTASSTRVFPDLQQIIDNNTNADTGLCPETPPIAPPVPKATTECFAEFLPTTDYVGFAGQNATPLSLHMRLTARDGKGGTSSADSLLLLANNAGPFLVASPNTATTWAAGSTKTVTWNVANTDVAPVNTTNVKISLSLDGGHTYPIVLDSSTANDGSDAVTVPNVVSTQARVKVEAVGNIFFDISNANFTITLPGVIGLDSVAFGGKGVLVDSYDSSAGPYGSGNNGNAAEVFSNHAVGLSSSSTHGSIRSALGPVSLDKGGLVTGDVRAGLGITNLGTIGGTQTPNSPSQPINAPPVAACSPYSSASGISGKFTYNAATGDLTVSGGKTATLADGTYCFHNVTLSGGSTLAVTGPVAIVVNGPLNGSGGSFVNATRIPSNLQLSSSYAGANGVRLSGGTSAFMSIYAPTTNVALSGNSPLFGAVLGRTLEASGSTAIHYDTQLLEVWASYFNP
jgi:hypothetical protein